MPVNNILVMSGTFTGPEMNDTLKSHLKLLPVLPQRHLTAHLFLYPQVAGV